MRKAPILSVRIVTGAIFSSSSAAECSLPPVPPSEGFPSSFGGEIAETCEGLATFVELTEQPTSANPNALTLNI